MVFVFLLQQFDAHGAWCKDLCEGKQGWHERGSPLPAFPAKQPQALHPALQEGYLLHRQKVTLNTTWSGHLDKCRSQMCFHYTEEQGTVNQSISVWNLAQCKERSAVSTCTYDAYIQLLEYPIPPTAAARHKNLHMAISREPSVVS